MSNSFQIQDLRYFKGKLLSYLGGWNCYSLLDSNEYYNGNKNKLSEYHSYDLLAGIGAKEILSVNSGHGFKDLYKFHDNQWLFGFLGYDLKNEVERLESANEDRLGFPEIFFFKPEIVLLVKGNWLTIIGDDPETVFKEISQYQPHTSENFNKPIELKAKIPKHQYLQKVEKIRDDIAEGEVYELNLCQEFYAENAEIDALALFEKMSEISPQPFSSFMRIEDKYIISASMERFLKKEGDKLISQPIKGTIRKGKDEKENTFLQKQLQNDEKERAENVMIVDLVRNDLARSCIPGSVKVEQLFGVYEFPVVNQMISTVSGKMMPDTSWIDAIRNAFPMGSMTGAPKVRAMQLIEEYEESRRGVYSGAIGYITPEGEFDFNVVIRTFLYNAAKKYLSIQVGSAITYDSVGENEYEECLLKIEGAKKALEKF